ncbi:MAG: prepilin-type N-terminal cleavage/methylation domain-containing protein [Opitutaceae bacterium]
MCFRFSIPDSRIPAPWLGLRAVRCRPSRIENLKSTIRSAFTLIEVLVALSIFALAVVVLGSSYLNVLTSYEVLSRGMQINEDIAFARQQVLRESDRKKLEQGGEFDTAGGRRARWSVEINSTLIPDVFTVAFTCELSDPARPEADKTTQTFTLLRPTWSIDAAERGKLKEDVKIRIAELQGKKQP